MTCPSSLADLYTSASYPCALEADHEGLHDDGQGRLWESEPIPEPTREEPS